MFSSWPQRVLESTPKSWPTGWTFWVNCYIENIFPKLSGLPVCLPAHRQLSTGFLVLNPAHLIINYDDLYILNQSKGDLIPFR